MEADSAAAEVTTGVLRIVWTASRRDGTAFMHRESLVSDHLGRAEREARH